jgi:hypothetical protein
MNPEVRQLVARALTRSRYAPLRDGLLRCGAPAASIEDLYALCGQALLLSSAGELDSSACDVLAEIVNASFRQTDAELPSYESAPSQPQPRLLTAARERPTLRSVRRERYDGLERETTLALGKPANDQEASEQTAEAFFAPRAPPAARAGSARGAILRKAGGFAEAESEDAETVVHHMDRVAMLGRHRAERPRWECQANEEQLLAHVDAVAAMGGQGVRTIVEWWRDEALDPWRTWAAIFALGCFEGTDTITSIAHALDGLPPEAGAHVTVAVDALMVAPHPLVADLARELAKSDRPISRAIGVETLGRRRALPVDALQRHLRDPNVPVLAAAIRSAGILGADAGATILLPYLRHPNVTVAWPAARQLALWGRPEPYYEVKNGGGQSLGNAALEILVQFGDDADVDTFDRIVSAQLPSETLLLSIARFGHSGAWRYLVHQLANPDLVDAAAEALTLLFGDRVEGPDVRIGAAWRARLARCHFDPSRRYRRGEPWTARAVVDDCARGNLTRAQLAASLDELAVRTGVPSACDLALWSADVAPSLDNVLSRLAGADGWYRAGSWDALGGGLRQHGRRGA